MSSVVMSFLKIDDPKKRDAIVADFIATRKKIQQRNLNEKAADLVREDELQTLFKPVIQSSETSTASLQNELKELNSNLKETLKEEKRDIIKGKRKMKEETWENDGKTAKALKHEDEELEDIIKRIGMSDAPKLDPYFSIQRVSDGYMMGTKKVTFDAENIYIDNEKYKGTPGLWKLIMMKKPPVQWSNVKQDLSSYIKILKQTDAANNPIHRTSRNRPFQTSKYKKIKKLLNVKSYGESIHFLPGDIKTLEDRLGVLLGEYRAGNQTSTRNEIVPIADELLRRKAISRKEYRDINTFLSDSLYI